MKCLIRLFLIVAVAILAVSCTLDSALGFQKKVKPFNDVATGIVAAYFGLPPGSAAAINATRSQLFGMAAQKWAKQPAAAGAVTPDLGAQLAAALQQSSPGLTDMGQANVLNNAALALPAATK